MCSDFCNSSLHSLESPQALRHLFGKIATKTTLNVHTSGLEHKKAEAKKEKLARGWKKMRSSAEAHAAQNRPSALADLFHDVKTAKQRKEEEKRKMEELQRQEQERAALTEMHQEVINTLSCPSQEKFHTFVLRGVRSISEAP